jgi:pimeloyl-ACP methyl ester carboxylesterase
MPDQTVESTVDNLTRKTRDEIWEIYNHPQLSMLEKRERAMKLLLPTLFYREEGMDRVDLNSLSISADFNARAMAELGSLDIFPEMEDIEVPTLVVVGRHDPSTSVRDQMAYADGIRTSSAIVFNGSGHFPFLEEPRLFTEVSKEFLLHGSLPALVRLEQ